MADKVMTTEDIKPAKVEEVKEEVKQTKKAKVKEEIKEVKPSKVTIHLIPAEWDYQEFVVCGINGTIYQINTGEDVEVPVEIAENLANAKRDMDECKRRARNNAKN